MAENAQRGGLPEVIQDAAGKERKGCQRRTEKTKRRRKKEKDSDNNIRNQSTAMTNR